MYPPPHMTCMYPPPHAGCAGSHTVPAAGQRRTSTALDLVAARGCPPQGVGHARFFRRSARGCWHAVNCVAKMVHNVFS